MEEVIVSCVIKHLSLVDALQSLINNQHREDHAEEYDLVCKIMAETFKKINAMERQLQSVAELEQKWQNEVEEAQQGKLENNTPFFHDYHFFENKIKELELLCSLKEVPLDFSDLENVCPCIEGEVLSGGKHHAPQKQHITGQNEGAGEREHQVQ
ncbi:hypothetical protein KUCAC02_028960, partial [Chaenocephalus aceratus]